jgi:hypothetical protein
MKFKHVSSRTGCVAITHLRSTGNRSTIILIEIFGAFIQSLLLNAGQCIEIGYGSLFPNSYLLTIHILTGRYITMLADISSSNNLSLKVFYDILTVRKMTTTVRAIFARF